jgi:asparagine synthase (glutamine-hydrolysing)
MGGMCSILAILDIDGDETMLRKRALKLSALLRHRGPDWSGVWADDKAVLAHERLAIVDPGTGAQPLVHPAGDIVLAVNGEIYNHRSLASGLSEPYAFATASDCEVLLPLYEQRGPDFLDDVSGIFAFVIYDQRRGDWLIARDPIGVVPLYTGRDAMGRLYVASEMKALIEHCTTLTEFPPGHYQTSKDSSPVRWYEPAWRDRQASVGVEVDLDLLRGTFEAAVHSQLMSDVPYGVLLSGGLDSSLVAAIAARYAAHRVEDEDRSKAWWPRLHSFAIGLAESPDLLAARTVADAIDSVHHEVVYTVQEGIDVLSDVIRHIETFDVTTVRASTPMYLLARYVKANGVKMVLSGEGSDEIFGGYLYFHKAPSAEEFHAETVRKLDSLHRFDCLRANKSMAAWGVEARVPFLDRGFLDVAMGFDAQHKMIVDGRMEKHVLREAFLGLIPDDVLWRQKEQFSDGVGYSWIDSLKAHAEAEVTDDELDLAAERFPRNTPASKEAYLYRSLFEQHFPGDEALALIPEGPSIACSTPTAIAWDQSFAAAADPSGRAIAGVHAAAYDKGSGESATVKGD